MTVLNSPPPRSASFFERAASDTAKPEPIRHVSQNWSGWFRNIYNVLKPGKTEDVVAGAVTLHFVNGVYIGHD